MDIQARGSVTLTGGSYSCKNPLLFFWAEGYARYGYLPLDFFIPWRGDPLEIVRTTLQTVKQI
jgi:hypothetical protein